VVLRILVTGGAGFIGSHLCDHFIAKGDDVVAIDNLVTGSTQNIEHLADESRFEFREIDIIDPFSIEGDIDVILHFASPASPPQYLKLPIETLRVGAHGTYNCLEIAKEKDARLLLASTSEVYGDPLEHPQKETYYGNVSTIGPRGVYDEAKRFAESITIAYHRTYGLQTRIVRIFNTYGPRMNLADGRVVPNFIVQALRGEPLTVYGDGMQTRSFQYVQDLIDGIQALLDSDYTGPVNIGNPYEMTIREFAETVNEVAENAGGLRMMPQERVEGDPQRRQPDISLAKKVLDWEPSVELRQGLEQTITYFREML